MHGPGSEASVQQSVSQRERHDPGSASRVEDAKVRSEER
jgi:hypothetical protein